MCDFLTTINGYLRCGEQEEMIPADVSGSKIMRITWVDLQIRHIIVVSVSISGYLAHYCYGVRHLEGGLNYIHAW